MNSITALLATLSLASAQTRICPPPGFASVTSLNSTEYTRATWYVQEQQVNGYQTPNDLFCVTATYELENAPSVPQFDGVVIGVYNYANRGGINQNVPIDYPTSPGLCAREVDPLFPSKLAVAPCFVPNRFAGPYWVIALGGDAGNYEWALVSGGEPTVPLEDGCTTSLSGLNDSGLWIFSRDQVLAPEKLAAAHQAAADVGISLAQMIVVPQVGCNYENAYIKA
jgi:hypothetical protein